MKYNGTSANSKIERGWRRAFEAYDLDRSADLITITSKQLNAIRDEGNAPDARNMVKFDTREQMPRFLRELGYSILPIAHGTYALVREDVFIDLPPRNKALDPTLHRLTSVPARLARESDSEATRLGIAKRSGLLDLHFGIEGLDESFGGRRRASSFDFSIGRIGPVKVDRIQYEIDGGYLDPLGSRGAIVEAKLGEPTNLLLRQLYFPHRDISLRRPDLDLRTAFMTCPRDSEDLFIFWDARFDDPSQYRSARITGPRAYRLVLDLPKSTEDLISRLPIARDASRHSVLEAPSQADDLEKVFVIPRLILAGAVTGKEIASHIGFDKRQGNYYKRAAATLGLLTPDTRHLTDTGRRFALSSRPQQELIMFTLLLNDPILRRVFGSLDTLLEKGSVSMDDVISIVAKTGSVSGSTVRRRAQTAVAWLGWVGQRTNLFKRTRSGLTAYPAP